MSTWFPASQEDCSSPHPCPSPDSPWEVCALGQGTSLREEVMVSPSFPFSPPSFSSRHKCVFLKVGLRHLVWVPGGQKPCQQKPVLSSV